MGKMQRTKGARAHSEFKKMLLNRDWIADHITAGAKSEDLIAEHPSGKRYSVEVKNHALIDIKRFRAQAIEQANNRKLPWMLAIKITGTSTWLVLRKDEQPVIWSME